MALAIIMFWHWCHPLKKLMILLDITKYSASTGTSGIMGIEEKGNKSEQQYSFISMDFVIDQEM